MTGLTNMARDLTQKRLQLLKEAVPSATRIAVIMDPSDPVVAARQKYIDDQGGNSFYQYSVPQAAISLKQGLGRLIRSTTDKGVLSILDPRVRTKSYERVFLQSIPQCRVTSNIEEAAVIFGDPD